MTAHWESVLTQISEKQCRYQEFMQPLVGTLYQLIEQARSTPVRQFRGLVAPGGAKKSFSKGKGKAKGKKAAEDAAPPPPHKLDDGYRGVEEGRIMTVEQAKTMHDGATVSLRGNLLTRQGDDRYQFRDKSGTITAIIPVAAFNEQHVEPDDLVSINGSLDRKMTPPVVRIDRLLKQSPK